MPDKPTPAVRIGVDTGGTFTDLCMVDVSTGQRTSLKLQSTPDEPDRAVVDGVRRLLEMRGVAPEDVAFLGHGTTVGINALLQRRGPRTGLLVTRGFRDLLELARQKRADLYDLQLQPRRPIVPRNLSEEVTERIAASGDVLVQLDLRDAERAVDALVDKGVESIAICFLHSYVNPDHEAAVRDLVRSRHPDVAVSASHDVLREFREYERLSTTVVNAYIAPPMSGYLTRLAASLADIGIAGERAHVSGSHGGLMSLTAAIHLPVTTIASGPAAGVTGAVHVGALDGRQNLLTMDIGGTSVDVSLIRDGVPGTAHDNVVADHPVKMPRVDVGSVGAGGGSIAWIDGGLLKVGPISAGAVPGPAAYGLGGEQPTVTDAELVLGRMDARHQLGGHLQLDVDLANAAIERAIAEPFGISVVEAAAGILEVTEANLVRALRRVSVEHGFDPADFTLVAFGGAGPLHGAGVAAKLGMADVIVPELSGLLCAEGLLRAQTQANFSHTQLMQTADGLDAVGPIFGELAQQAEEWLDREHVADDDRELRYAIDMRYEGQNHELTVPLSSSSVPSREALEDSFHAIHEESYGYADKLQPTTLVTFRLTALGRMAHGQASAASPSGSAPVVDERRRPVYFDGRDPLDTPIRQREALTPSVEYSGPLIVEQMDTTTVVPPNALATLLPSGSLRIAIADTSKGE